jgi:uncharacterized membrane protein required for colicin V production
MLMLLGTLLATSMLQRFGDLLVGGIMLALVAYGAQSGLFLAVLAGMHALVSVVVALAFADPLAALLTTFELPVFYAFPAAFGLLLVGTAFGVRLLVGEYVPADVVRFAPVIDKLGGGLVGAVAGMVVAGTFLLACSIAPVPETFRIDGTKLGYDMGTRLLKSFARCVEPDEVTRNILLDGEPGRVPPPPPEVDPEALAADAERQAIPVPVTPPTPPPPPLWSEPFADQNGNKQYDPGEPYLDTDNNQAFTERLLENDVNSNGIRDIGLLERYRMHAWGKQVMASFTKDESAQGAEALALAAAPTGDAAPAVPAPSN